MTMRQYSISAFFPAYNDEGTIGSIVRSTASMLPKLTTDFEIVVVNDGSVDNTGKLLRALACEIPSLKVIEHPANRGYGAALITGFSSCSKDLIFYTDGDGQYDVKELPLLLKAFSAEVDLVNGYKISRSDPLHRIIIGHIYQYLMRFMFQLKIKDVDCDFRLFRRSLFLNTPLTFESGVICVEMMKKFERRGYRIVEVPVHHYPRSYGSSQFFTVRHLRMIFGQLFVAWCSLVAAPLCSRRSRLPKLTIEARRTGVEIE